LTAGGVLGTGLERIGEVDRVREGGEDRVDGLFPGDQVTVADGPVPHGRDVVGWLPDDGPVLHLAVRRLVRLTDRFDFPVEEGLCHRLLGDVRLHRLTGPAVRTGGLAVFLLEDVLGQAFQPLRRTRPAERATEEMPQ
jgi:hypothetical protein